MPRPQRPRISPIAGPILGEFLIGISVAMVTLWMASCLSDAAAGARREPAGARVAVRAVSGARPRRRRDDHAGVGGPPRDAARRTALVCFGACTWLGAVAALWLLLTGDWTLALLNAPAAAAAIGAPYLLLLALAAWRRCCASASPARRSTWPTASPS